MSRTPNPRRTAGLTSINVGESCSVEWGARCAASMAAAACALGTLSPVACTHSPRVTATVDNGRAAGRKQLDGDVGRRRVVCAAGCTASGATVAYSLATLSATQHSWCVPLATSPLTVQANSEECRATPRSYARWTASQGVLPAARHRHAAPILCQRLLAPVLPVLCLPTTTCSLTARGVLE